MCAVQVRRFHFQSTLFNIYEAGAVVQNFILTERRDACVVLTGIFQVLLV